MSTMPIGYNPNDPDWYKKLTDAAITPTTAAPSTVKVGDMVGPMPAGWGSPTYQTDIGKTFDPITGKVTEVAPIPDVPGALGGNTPVIPPIDDIPTVNPLTKKAGVNINTTGHSPFENYESPVAAPTAKDYIALYGDKIQYTSPYTKDYWNEAREVFRKQLEGSTNPALQKALAGEAERSIRLGGVSSGLIAAGQQPILESYANNLTTQMGEFEKARLNADIAEASKASDFNLQQQLDEKAWNRSQYADALGKDYAQKLNEFDANLEYSYWNKKNSIQEAYNDKQMDWQEAQTKSAELHQEKMAELQNHYDKIMFEMQMAENENNFVRQQALQREAANVQRDITIMQNNAQEDSAKWGALGSVVGAAAGVATGGVVKKLFNW